MSSTHQAALGRRPFADGLTILYRNLLVLRRNPAVVGSSLAGPLGMLLLFGYVFAEAMAGSGSADKYREALIPAVFILVSATSLLLTAGSTALDVSNGVTDRLRSMPTQRFALPFGLVGSQLVMSALSLGVMAMIAVLIGWRTRTDALSVVAGFGLVLLFGYALSWVGVVIGLAIRNAEVIQQFSAALFSLVLFSNAFAPTDSMPTVFRVIAEWNPVSAANTAARTLFDSSAVPDGPWPLAHAVLATVIWSIALTAIFAPIAARMYSKPD